MVALEWWWCFGGVLAKVIHSPSKYVIPYLFYIEKERDNKIDDEMDDEMGDGR